MSHEQVGIKDIGDLCNVLHHYYPFGGYFDSMSKSDTNKIIEHWETNVIKGKTFIEERNKPNIIQYWNNIDIHIVRQSWANTSGGWEGIGGSAFTDDYTIIIENKYHKSAYIYYDGKPAYIVAIDDLYKDITKDGYTRMPGRTTAFKKLNVIYRF